MKPLKRKWAQVSLALHYLGWGLFVVVGLIFSDLLAGLLEVADKEFQEIRDFLTEYQKRVEVEMEGSGPEPPDSELDAVVLEAMINTKPNLQTLNRRIGEIAGMEINAQEPQEKYVGTLEELKYLGICTTAQLDQCVERSAGLAVYVADKLLRDRYKIEPEGTTLLKTIGVFYLCYAELILNKWDKERIIQYLKDNAIGKNETRAAFAQELLEYGRAFAAQN